MTTSVVLTSGDAVLPDVLPTAAAADAGGNIYVADVNLHAVRKITAAGTISNYIGSTADATVQYDLGTPGGLALDPAGNVYVAAQNGDIVKVTPAGSASVAFQAATVYAPEPGGYTDSRGSIYPAQQFAVDASGNLYVTVTCSGVVRKVSPQGSVTTLATGLGIATETQNLGGASGSVVNCTGGANGIAIDAAGEVYASDTLNHRIEMISAHGENTGYISLVGASGSDPMLNAPQTLSVDKSGNIYVVDAGKVWDLAMAGSFKLLFGSVASKAEATLPNSTAQDESGVGAAIMVGSDLFVVSSYSTVGWALVKFSGF